MGTVVYVLEDAAYGSILGVYTSRERMQEAHPEFVSWTETSAYSERSIQYGVAAARIYEREIDL